MKEAFVPLPTQFTNLHFYNCLSLLLEADPQKYIKKNTVRIQLSTLLSNAQKTARIENQVSNQVQQLQAVRSASSGPNQLFEEVM